MKTLAAFGVLVMIGILAGSNSPALGAADTDRGFSVKVDRSTLRSGETLTATGHASAPCAWIIDWNNERRSANGKRLVATFVAPEVTKVTRIPLRGTCFYITKAPTRPTPTQTPVRPDSISQRVTVTVPKSWNQTITITVLPSRAIVSPPAPGGDGDLPNTGGPDLWILLAGIAALLVGASMIRLATPEELPFPMS